MRRAKKASPAQFTAAFRGPAHRWREEATAVFGPLWARGPPASPSEGGGSPADGEDPIPRPASAAAEKWALAVAAAAAVPPLVPPSSVASSGMTVVVDGCSSPQRPATAHGGAPEAAHSYRALPSTPPSSLLLS